MDQRPVSNAPRRLTKQDCAALRAQLTDLGYGQAEAETPELFAHRLYPVSEHLRALDSGVVLVVGPRGSGKSALFSAFFSENRDLAEAIARWSPRPSTPQVRSGASQWTAAYPSGTAFPDSHALAKWVRSDEDAKKVWHAMLVRSLADRLGEHQTRKLQPIFTPMAVDVGAILSPDYSGRSREKVGASADLQ